ncbi:hypothetical protein [Rubrivirga sp.]|uniref:hypothetical protein n=1 Tax=Rubrivirga sp. TaxID=1885344 RepID=UPI003B522A97
MRRLLLLALLVSAPAVAQPVADAACSYADCALRIERGYFSTQIVRGSVEAPETVSRLSLFGGTLADAVAGSPLALDHAEQSRADLRGGFLMGLAGVALYVAAIVPNDELSDGVRTGFLTSGIGLSIGSGVLLARGQRGQARAVWEYNRTFAE